MVSARVSRIFAVLLALLAGVAVPATSVAHGFAHSHARMESPDHHDEHGQASIEDADHAKGDHAHPQLDRGTAVRFVDHSPPIGLPEQTGRIGLIGIVVKTVVAAAARPRADPGDGPPPLPRSPPLS